MAPWVELPIHFCGQRCSINFAWAKIQSVVLVVARTSGANFRSLNQPGWSDLTTVMDIQHAISSVVVPSTSSLDPTFKTLNP